MEDLIRYLIALLDPTRSHRGSIKLWQQTADPYMFEVAHSWHKHGCDKRDSEMARAIIEDMEPMGHWSLRIDHAQYMVVSTPVAGAYRIVVSFENPVDAVHYRLLTA